MKKLIGLLVAGITISAFMAGCNKPSEGDNAPPTTSDTSSTSGPGKTANPITPSETPTKPTPSKPAGGPPGATTGGAATGK